MFKSILIFLFTSQIALAYTNKDIHLNSFRYTKYVRPQLNSIYQDYQTLLSKLNPNFVDTKKVFAEYRAIQNINTKKSERCLTDHKKCPAVFEDQLKSLLKILNYTANIILVTGEFSSVKTSLLSEQKYNQFRSQLYSTINKIQLTAIFNSTQELTPYDLAALKKMTMRSESLFNLYLLNTSDTRFTKHLTLFWSDFIRPTFYEVIIKNRMQFFIYKISDLNFAWNSLHVILTKRGKKIDKSVITLLNVMHRRWNNILKVTLRR